MSTRRWGVAATVITLVAWSTATAEVHSAMPQTADIPPVEAPLEGESVDPALAVPPTTVPPTTMPSTTMPPSSVPGSTAPSASVSPTSVPPTSVPPTSVPASTVPPTTAPPTTAPPTTAPPTTAPPTTAPPADAEPSVGPVEATDAPAVRLDEPTVPPTEPTVPPEELAVADTLPPDANPEPAPPVNPVWLQTGSSRSHTAAGGAATPIPGRAPAGERLAPVGELDVILATIRQLESGHKYDIGPNRASASGAYQYIPSTWNGYAGFSEAYLAPAEVQDERARTDVQEILTRFAGDVSMVPIIWYYPRAVNDETWMDRVPNPAGGNQLTVREYQARWLDMYRANYEAYSAYFDPSTDPGRAAVVSVDQATLDWHQVMHEALTGTTDDQLGMAAPPVPMAEPVDPALTPEELAVLAERAARARATLAAEALAGRTLPTTTTTTVPALPPVDAPVADGGPLEVAATTPPEALPPEAVPPATAIPPFVVNDGAMTDEALSWAERSAIPADVTPLTASRPIVFPVLGPVTFGDGWGDCRDGCQRRHVGTDIIGVQMQPLLAAVDGTITRLSPGATGISGAAISIADAEGWRYNYFHVNNDTPGTDDGAALDVWQLAPGLELGSEVVAGQIVGYMGNSGNAEASTTHLHFEYRDPAGVPHPSYAALRAAAARQACTIGIGPWSTPRLAAGADLRAGSVDPLGMAEGPDGQLIDLDTGVPVDPEHAASIVSHTVVTPMFGSGQWTIDTDGRVTATGDAALIIPARDLACAPGPLERFGTDAAGWQTALDAHTLTGTTLDGVDLTGTVLEGLVPLATIPPVDPETQPIDGVALDGDPPPNSRVHAFRMPSSGEVILLVFPA